MKQQDFLKLFSKNINKVQYSAGDDLKGHDGHEERRFKQDISKDEIRKLNKAGYGIYFTVNKFPSRQRRKSLVQRVRAVFVEDDKTGSLVTDWPLSPSIVIESSPNKFHYYWLTSTKKFKEYDLVMQTMVDEYNCDNHARDISRVLRIPGTYHHKKKKFRVKVIGGNSKKYDWKVVTTAFPPAKKKKSNYSSDSEGTFDIQSAVAELTSTNDLHGSMISIAMSMANQGIKKELFIQFMMLAYGNINFDDVEAKRAIDISSRFDEIHLDECFDSAIKKIDEEVEEAEEIEDIEENVKATKLSADILAPKNTVLGDLTRAIMKTWWKPNLMVASLAARQTIAYIAGGNYKANTNDRLNIQQVAVGESGVGKDPLISITPEVISQCFRYDKKLMAALLRGVIDEAGSQEGLDGRIRSLGHKHDLIFVKDEIGELMQQAASGNQAKMGLFSYILKMYTKSNGVSNERALAKKKGDEDSEVLYAPHFLVSAATTPSLILDGLSANFVSTGLMSRLMLFNADSYADKRLREVSELKLSKRIKESLKEMINTKTMTNSDTYNMPSARLYNPKIVEFPAEVIEYCYKEACRDDKRTGELKAIWNRRVPNAKKYAMIEAVAENPSEPIVTMEIMKRNMIFVENSCEYTVNLFTNSVGEHVEDIAAKDIVRILKKYQDNGKLNEKGNISKGGKYVSRAIIMNSRKVLKLSSFQKDSVVRALVKDGIIEEVKIEINGRGNNIKHLYRLLQWRNGNA